MSNKLTTIIASIALFLAIVAVIITVFPAQTDKIVGTVGTLNIEDYLPIIKHNEGYYSAYGITTTATLTAATVTGTTLNASGATDVSTFTQGGGVFATSSDGAVLPLLAANFDTENMLDVTLNIVDGTLSFPATSTLTSFIPTAGDTRTIFVRNASTTAAMDLTIAGGTGVLLKNASSTNATQVSPLIGGDTDGANYARLQFLRKVNTDIEMFVEIFKD